MVEIVKKRIEDVGEEASRKKRNTNISAALSGKPKGKEQVIERSTVWEKVRPLFLRGALIEEISDVTNFSLKQVSNAIYRRRPDWHSLPITVFSKERVRERKSRVSSRRPRRLDLRPTAKAKGNSLEFSKRLVAQGLFGDDLSYWDRMVLAYKDKNRKLPIDLPDKLRLEIFLKAIEEARSGNLTLINLYRNIGLGIDPFWFDTSLMREEDFVATIAGSKPSGVGEDMLGFYRNDEDGKWRQPVAYGERGIIVDSTRQALCRQAIREWKQTAS